ncbi:tetratricopeptide repeat protein, partial [Candidatus Kaiserbacteria bacterium]|nr:tetratricopeptide repeat protein [Candidatus Kaiserbacteria bacterium]
MRFGDIRGLAAYEMNSMLRALPFKYSVKSWLTRLTRIFLVCVLLAMPVAQAALIGEGITPNVVNSPNTTWHSITLALWEKQDWLALITVCEKWGEAEPAPWEPWLCLAHAGLNSNQYQVALRGFEEYRRRVNATALTQAMLHNHAYVLSELGRYEEAIIRYKEALAADGSNHITWSNLGWVLVNVQLYEEAVETCLTAIRMRPDYAEAWGSLGAAYRGLRQYEQAIAAYEKAISFPNGHSNKAGSAY